MNVHTACDQSRDELQKLERDAKGRLVVAVRVGNKWQDSPTKVDTADEAVALGARIFSNWPDVNAFRVKRRRGT
jgi:hypothetical protein